MVRFEEINGHTVVRNQLARLADLFDEMSGAYREQARQYGFECDGCQDNCCQTRFHHHTVLELLFLHQGLLSLPASRHTEVLARCRRVNQVYRETQNDSEPVRVLCPLNEEGHCIIYRQRPMICRLHGIPHELHMPAGGVQHHPGCATFTRRMGAAYSYRCFDRTPFYRYMAVLENELRQTFGFQQRLKLTVAQILLADELLKEIASALHVSAESVATHYENH